MWSCAGTTRQPSKRRGPRRTSGPSGIEPGDPAMKLLPSHTLPAKMKALATIERGVELVERAVPVPKRGQLLIHMRAAPINPNDLMFLDGVYEIKKPLGTIAGFEGSGTV